MRRLGILTIVLSVFFIIILIPRVQNVDYYHARQSNDLKMFFEYDFFRVEVYINKEKKSSQNIVVHYNFRNIESVLLVEFLDLKLKNGYLSRITPFDAMDLKRENFPNFNTLPDSKRLISEKSKEYYSFEHEFSMGNNDLNTLDLEIHGLIRHGETTTDINEEITFDRKSSLKLVPTDNHSDFLFLLIWPLGIILIFLIIVIIVKTFLKKRRSPAKHQ